MYLSSFIKVNYHPYFPITLSRIICYTYITPATDRIFILSINIVPWGRDLLNLKEVVGGTLFLMNLSLL